MVEIVPGRVRGRPRVRRIRALIPRSGALLLSESSRRHRQLVWVLWLDAGMLVLFGSWFDSNLVLATAEVSPVAMLAVLAGHPRLPARIRASLVGAGLVAASALLVFMSDGSPEAHLQFFASPTSARRRRWLGGCSELSRIRSSCPTDGQP